MTQYVTLVSGWWTVEGKSHILAPNPSETAMGTLCGRAYSTYDDGVTVTDAPECKGVCKLCERKSK